MPGVVVEGADYQAARPGSDSGEGRALEFSSHVARFQVLHIAVLSVGDPCGKNAKFGKVADGSDAAEIESGVMGALPDAGLKVGRQMDVRC